MLTTLRLWIVNETELAYCFSTTDEKRDGTVAWVPRSMVERITKLKPEPGKWRACEVEIQEWLAEKKGLL